MLLLLPTATYCYYCYLLLLQLLMLPTVMTTTTTTPTVLWRLATPSFVQLQLCCTASAYSLPGAVCPQIRSAVLGRGGAWPSRAPWSDSQPHHTPPLQPIPIIISQYSRQTCQSTLVRRFFRGSCSLQCHTLVFLWMAITIHAPIIRGG